MQETLTKFIRVVTRKSIPALISDRTGPYRTASSPLPTNEGTRLGKNLEFVSLLEFFTKGYVSKKKIDRTQSVFFWNSIGKPWTWIWPLPFSLNLLLNPITKAALLLTPLFAFYTLVDSREPSSVRFLSYNIMAGSSLFPKCRRLWSGIRLSFERLKDLS